MKTVYFACMVSVAQFISAMATCPNDCQKAYEQCKIDAHKRGELNFASCIHAKDDCLKKCSQK